MDSFDSFPSSYGSETIGADDSRLSSHDVYEEELGILVGLDLTLLLVFTTFLLWYYRSPLVPWVLSLCVGTAWYLGFCGTLLLPADVADAMINGNGQGSSSWVLSCWYAIYWSTFLLSWVVLPVARSAWHAGELTWRLRVKAALRDNVRQYVIMAVGGLVGVVYLLASGQSALGDLSGLIMALGNTYGLLLIIVLLGYGLVEMPRSMWQLSFLQNELDRMYFRATQLDTTLYDAIFELDDVDVSVDKMQRRVAALSPHQKLVDGVEDLMVCIQRTREDFDSMGIDRFQGRQQQHGGSAAVGDTAGRGGGGGGGERGGRGRGIHNMNGGGGSNSAVDFNGLPPTDGDDVTRQQLVEMHAHLRRAQDRVTIAKHSWDDLLNGVARLEQLRDGSLPYPRSTSGPDASFFSRVWHFLYLLLQRFSWYWQTSLSGRCNRALSVVCCWLSVLILWSEVVIGVTSYNLSPFGQILRVLGSATHHTGESTPVILQVAAMVPFLYMSVCCYRALFKIKLFGEFSLKPRHHSLPGPLLFNAQYLCRLQFSLGYNYLQVLGASSGRVVSFTAFQDVMSDMEVVPLLGTSFNVYAPLMMVVLCIFTFGNGYARMLQFIGLEHEDLLLAVGGEGKDRIQEGKSLIDRSMRQRLNREKRLQQQQQLAGGHAAGGGGGGSGSIDLSFGEGGVGGGGRGMKGINGLSPPPPHGGTGGGGRGGLRTHHLSGARDGRGHQRSGGEAGGAGSSGSGGGGTPMYVPPSNLLAGGGRRYGQVPDQDDGTV